MWQNNILAPGEWAPDLLNSSCLPLTFATIFSRLSDKTERIKTITQWEVWGNSQQRQPPPPGKMQFVTSENAKKAWPKSNLSAKWKPRGVFLLLGRTLPPPLSVVGLSSWPRTECVSFWFVTGFGAQRQNVEKPCGGGGRYAQDGLCTGINSVMFTFRSRTAWEPVG